MKRLSKKWIIPLVLFAGLTFLLRSGVLAGSKEQVKASELSITVNATEAKMTDIVPVLSFSGSLEGQTSATIGAKISGRIEQVLVQEGQAVKAGDPLVKLEAVELANTVRQAADVVRKGQANYDLAVNDYNRYKTLYDKGAVSEQQLDNAKAKLKTAEADLSSAAANHSSTQQQYSYGLIGSPIDGVIANKEVTVGQIVAPGTALMLVQDIHRVYAVVNVEQRDLGKIKIGQKANITVDAYPDMVFTGIVEVMNPDAGSASRMFKTKIAIDNTAGDLKPGMFAKVEVVTGESAQILAVPQSALIQKQGISYVYKLENGKAVRKLVEIGEVTGTSIVVKTGLQAGEQVISSNVNRLKDGDAVKVSE